jgi:FAD/FMN-containing dehydrogenase
VNHELLTKQLRGDVLTPGDHGYAASSTTFFTRGAPGVVVRPVDADDVAVAIRYAQARSLLLSVRSGGHSLLGHGTNTAGMVLDLARLNTVELVDPATRIVRVGGGATWGRVAAALEPHGLGLTGGDTAGVGVGGLTLGGGIGWMVRKHGLTIDNLVAARVVTAAGEVLAANGDENPELFWAIRGGGGNLGIVTAFEFAAHPTIEVFFGKVTFPAAEAADVLQGWADYLRTAPDELTSTANLANPFAGGPEAPVEIHVTFDGDDPELAARAIDPIRGLGTVVEDDVALKPYADILAEGATPPPGIQVVAKNAFVDRESVPDILQILAGVGTSQGSPSISIHNLTGAVSRVPDDATAYAHRHAELMVTTFTGGPKPVIEAARPGLDAIWEKLAPHVDGAYANFLASATEEDVAAVYPTQTYRRLAAVKRQYDPSNLFARNHNVRPE